jgi:hypothetical protein
MNNELERIWKEAVVVSSMYYSGIYLEGLRKAKTKTFWEELIAYFP